MRVSPASNTKFQPEANDTENIKKSWQQFSETNPRKEIFFDLDPEHSLRKEIASRFVAKKHFVHVGMGGSALGPETMIKALVPDQAHKFTFFNNIDSDEIFHLLNLIDLENTVFYIVSKSGTTIETLALLNIIHLELEKKIGQNYQRNNYFVFCTGPKTYLRDLGDQWGVSTLTLPVDIGGRYSTLSNVGLFPLEFAGLNTKEISEHRVDFAQKLGQNDELFNVAMTLLAEYKQKGVNQTVMMPYSSILKSFSLWFVQLWAESLGKKNIGLTPIFSYGPTDQHSQMQLFMEGPRDKFLFFIEVEKPQHPMIISKALNQEKMLLCEGLGLHDILKAELEGTKSALDAPFYNISIEEINSQTLTELFVFFEALTIIVGQLLEIDPFDQPGVELGKKLCIDYLKQQNS
jgi:glucose-6-phosphate isomerase